MALSNALKGDMLPWIGAALGLAVMISLTFALGFALACPDQWKRFLEWDRTFWIKCGIPRSWADKAKELERGWPLKVMIACDILIAIILIFSSVWHWHRV